LELNTRCWLHELFVVHGGDVTLSNVPDTVVADWARLGITHIWLMGVWTTGPRCRERALSNGFLRAAYDRVLPDWQDKDVAGSPYAIQSYTVSAALGGEEGLRTFRQQLGRQGLRLILDFVPNHVGLDHAWLNAHPEYFVCSPEEGEEGFRQESTRGVHWIAHGRDPHFASWNDTAQLDYRCQSVHEAMQSELLRLTTFCDGVRCDMAMLILKEVFARTWEAFPITDPQLEQAEREFWEVAIPRAKASNPDFLFLAEVYWDMERRLQSLGFDYTYDKVATDALLDHRGADFVERLTRSDPDFIERSVHFLENHDERRAAASLRFEEHRAAAVAMLALPGMRFLHDGQMQGATLQTPVQLARRQAELPDGTIVGLYARILAAFMSAGVGSGAGRVLRARPAWHDNPSHATVLVVLWGGTSERFALAAVNLASHQSQCRVPLPMGEAAGSFWALEDALGDEKWQRSSEELRRPGLFLDLAPQAAQLFVFEPI
jgi:hypothetical protein